MATTISHRLGTELQQRDVAPGGEARPTDTRVRNLDVVRRFVEQIVAGENLGPTVEVSCLEWDAIWSAGSNQETIQGAIARVVLAAQARRPDVGWSVNVLTGQPTVAPVDPLSDWADPPYFDDPAFTAIFSLRPPKNYSSGAPMAVPSLYSGLLEERSAPRPGRESGYFDLLPGFPGAVVEPTPKTAAVVRLSGAEEKRRLRLLKISTWVRNIGALMIIFAAWQVWGTSIAQHHTQQSLSQQFAAKVHAAPKPLVSVGNGLVPATVRVADAPEGTVEAHIQIPEIGVDQFVVSGTAADDLAKGPGHYIGTAMPGQAGNVAIAGHRTTHGAPFNRLDQLAIGDPIYLTTSSGQRLTYVVAQTPFPVSPSDVAVLNNFNDNRLTLTTCNPKFSAVQRLIVVAEYQAPNAAVVSHPVVARGHGTPYKHVKNAGESGWNVGVLPLVLLEGALLALLGLGATKLSRMYGPVGRWLILAPIWVAGIYALFVTLTSFLPAAA